MAITLYTVARKGNVLSPEEHDANMLAIEGVLNSLALMRIQPIYSGITSLYPDNDPETAFYCGDLIGEIAV